MKKNTLGIQGAQFASVDQESWDKGKKMVRKGSDQGE
jgi:hypothetical protein